MPDPVTPAILDAATLETLRRIGGCDAAFFAEMVQIFFEDSPPRLAEIGAALGRGDLGAAGKAAHSIKGGASNFGALHFRGLAEQIEHRAKAGDAAPLSDLFAQLQAEYPRVVAALELETKKG